MADRSETFVYDVTCTHRINFLVRVLFACHVPYLPDPFPPFSSIYLGHPQDLSTASVNLQAREQTLTQCKVIHSDLFDPRIPFGDPFLPQDSSLSSIVGRSSLSGWSDLYVSDNIPNTSEETVGFRKRSGSSRPTLLSPFKYWQKHRLSETPGDKTTMSEPTSRGIVEPSCSAQTSSKRSGLLTQRRPKRKLSLDTSHKEARPSHQVNLQGGVKSVDTACIDPPSRSESPRGKSSIRFILNSSSTEEAHAVNLRPCPGRPGVTAITRPQASTSSTVPTSISDASQAEEIKRPTEQPYLLPPSPRQAQATGLHDAECASIKEYGKAQFGPALITGLGVYNDPQPHGASCRVNSTRAWSPLEVPTASASPGTTALFRYAPSSADLRDTSQPTLASYKNDARPSDDGADEILAALESHLEASTNCPILQCSDPVIRDIQSLNRSLSRVRNHGPLSSHPPRPPISPLISNRTPVLASLHRVFPSTSKELISSLYATLLAMNFISYLPTLSPKNRSKRSYHPYDEAVDADHGATVRPNHYNLGIPPKARAVLGLPELPPLPRRPTLPSSWIQQEQTQFKASKPNTPQRRDRQRRVSKVKKSLQLEFEELWEWIFDSNNEDVTFDDGMGMGERDVLGRALGELVTVCEQ